MQSLHLKQGLCVQLQVLRGQHFIQLGRASASWGPRPLHRQNTLGLSKEAVLLQSAQNGHVQQVRVCFPLLWCPGFILVSLRLNQ